MTALGQRFSRPLTYSCGKDSFVDIGIFHMKLGTIKELMKTEKLNGIVI